MGHNILLSSKLSVFGCNISMNKIDHAIPASASSSKTLLETGIVWLVGEEALL